ncbi:MAG: hypothetical protein KIT13_05655 [Burkholderiales bacterium]|nr:hypothetical protein [Burkholderiales bacterium]MCW5603295.1 hypothetical protein [Burkholderiales bacterium]
MAGTQYAALWLRDAMYGGSFEGVNEYFIAHELSDGLRRAADGGED